MAATRALARGYKKQGAPSEASRLGHEFSEAEANTWQTFGMVHMNKDGRGYFELKDDAGRTLVSLGWGSEDQNLREILVRHNPNNAEIRVERDMP